MSFKKIKHWIFDLDNTLYPSSTNLFLKIDFRMKRFIMEKLSLNAEKAYKLQKQYYLKYGTTLNGLILNHAINPKEYLEYVHNIDISSIKPDFNLKNEIKNLNGIKYIYTNGSKAHAERLLIKLDILEYFENIYDIELANFLPKPSLQSLNNFLEYYKINPKNAAFFEDIARNLINAKKIGIKTLLIKSKNHPDKNQKIFLLKESENKYIDHTTTNLANFLYKINLDNIT